MAKLSKVSAFVSAMQEIHKNWDKLSVDDRQQSLQNAINNSFPEELPEVELNISDLDVHTMGQMDPSTFSIDVNKNLFEGTMTDEKFIKLSNTLYHEGRHIEQFFSAAQWKASQGDTPEDIQVEMGLPESIANAAANNPAPSNSPESHMGESVFHSVYGDRSEYRNDVYETLDNTPQIEDFDSKEEFNAAVELYDISIDQYYALPEETDAFSSGDEAERKMKKALSPSK
jgi:hypothetical protein